MIVVGSVIFNMLMAGLIAGKKDGGQNQKMPYKVKGKCVYKKDTGKKVGCTDGPVKDYLAALYASANESTEITKEELKEIILNVLNEHAKDFVWGAKNPDRIANQYELKTLKNQLLKDKETTY